MLCCWKKQKRYKKCGSQDDQSWHVTVRECDSNCKRIYWLRKNWPTLKSSSHWTTAKYWISALFAPPTRISKRFFPINMSRSKSWFPLLYKGACYYTLSSKLFQENCLGLQFTYQGRHGRCFPVNFSKFFRATL